MSESKTTPEYQDERLRYDKTHWSAEEDAIKALDQYLRLGEKTYNKTKSKLFMAMTGDIKGKKILDYGGGTGIMAIPYAKAGADVMLVDAEANALQTARFYARKEGVEGKVRTLQADSCPPSLKGERFDVIIAKDIIEHIKEDQQSLIDLSHCQDRDGILLLSSINSRSLNYLLEGSFEKHWRGNTAWCGWDQTHLRFYTPTSLRHKLEKAGYRADQWASVYLLPYNILSWLFLLKFTLDVPALHYLDLTLGRVFPFNRLGWNIIVAGTKV